MATETALAPDNTETFQQLESYHWEKDAEFQGGLSAILGSTTDPSQIQELTLRAQVFYFTRKKSIPIDFDAYKAYIFSKSSTNTSDPPAVPSHQPQPPSQTPPAASTTSDPTPTNTTMGLTPLQSPSAPYPPTFAEIVQLITTGAPIPGIKDIPSTLLTSQATKPVVSKRRKPWEVDVPEEAIAGKEGGKVEGTFGDRRDEVIVQELPE